jgi:hypothetical protein
MGVSFTEKIWSFKIPAVTQHEKYMLSNLEYYVDFGFWLSNVDLK